jgi:Raf kinase inhibitor-like YbhB/YbcL family protein
MKYTVLLLASLGATPAFAQVPAQLPAGGSARGAGGRGPAAPPPDPFGITLPAFPDGSRIPDKYTCAGGPAQSAPSPEIKFGPVPKGTVSFVLLMHDPEFRNGKGVADNTHWLVWNIPGDSKGLPEGFPVGNTLPDGTHQLARRAGTQGAYLGPCAPLGLDHHYTWTLYALDTKLDLPESASRAEIFAAAEGHVIGSTEFIGLFHKLL